MTKSKRPTVESFKVRKTGGSYVVTLSESVRNALDVEIGDSIRYVITEDNEVRMEKNVISMDFETATESAVEQYMKLLDNTPKD